MRRGAAARRILRLYKRKRSIGLGGGGLEGHQRADHPDGLPLLAVKSDLLGHFVRPFFPPKAGLISATSAPLTIAAARCVDTSRWLNAFQT